MQPTRRSESLDDVTRALAFVARRQGHQAMPAEQWALVLSLDLGWMSPAQARQFVERARAANVLEERDGQLRLRVEPAAVDIPRGFRPSPDAVPSDKAPDPFPIWLEKVAKHTGRSKEAVLQELAQRQERLGGWIDAQAALLWLAADGGLDVRDAARAHLASLRSIGQAAPAAAARP